MSPKVPGLPEDAVDQWLRRVLPDLIGRSGWSAEVLSGGLSNITYRLHLKDGATVILRRPPLGGVLQSAHDMAREYRVLTALSPTLVPVPTTLALCSNADVLGYPFYVMSDVRGEVPGTGADTAKLTVGQRAAMSEQLVNTVVALHEVDFDAVGLRDYGRPDGYTARQVRRWGEQWMHSRTRELPDMDRLLAELESRVPGRSDNTIVHGDYRFDNTIFDLTGPPRIRAVIDWELSTLGDPLADLGMAMTYWHDLGDVERELVPVAVGVTAHEGFGTADQFAHRYAQQTGRDLSLLPFYRGLGSMKLAAILEGVRARHAAGNTVSGGYDDVGDPVPALVAAGLRQLRLISH